MLLNEAQDLTGFELNVSNDGKRSKLLLRQDTFEAVEKSYPMTLQSDKADQPVQTLKSGDFRFKLQSVIVSGKINSEQRNYLSWGITSFFCIASAVVVIILIFSSASNPVKPKLVAFTGSFSMLFIICSLLYCVNAKKAVEFTSNVWFSESQAKELFKNAEQARPILNQNIECYHNVERGNHESNKITFAASIPKKFDDFIDYSSRVDFSFNIRSEKIYKIYVDKQWTHANEETKTDFELQRERIINENKNKDILFNYNEEYIIPLPDVVMVNRDFSSENAVKPWYYDECLYWICVCFGLGCVWSYLIDFFCTVKFSYPSLKVLSIRKMPDAEKRKVEVEKNNNISYI